jgi:uncharacterized protein DUF4239
MIAFLYSLSDLSVAVLFSAVAAVAFTVAPLLRVRLFGEVSEASSEFARTTMTAITGFTGVVLAFSLVQAQGNLRAVERTVATEAMQLHQIDRTLTSYGDERVTAIRDAVRAYTQSVVADEWPKLSEGGNSEVTAELFHGLSQRILAIEPASARQNIIYGDLVKMVDQLAESRQDRLGATNLALPAIYWEAIGFLMVLLITFSAFVEPRRAVSLGGLGAGLALLVTLVFIFDQPFLGDISVTPDPLVKVLAAMDGRAPTQPFMPPGANSSSWRLRGPYPTPSPRS